MSSSPPGGMDFLTLTINSIHTYSELVAWPVSSITNNYVLPLIMHFYNSGRDHECTLFCNLTAQHRMIVIDYITGNP